MSRSYAAVEWIHNSSVHATDRRDAVRWRKQAAATGHAQIWHVLSAGISSRDSWTPYYYYTEERIYIRRLTCMVPSFQVIWTKRAAFFLKEGNARPRIGRESVEGCLRVFALWYSCCTAAVLSSTARGIAVYVYSRRDGHHGIVDKKQNCPPEAYDTVAAEWTQWNKNVRTNSMAMHCTRPSSNTSPSAGLVLLQDSLHAQRDSLMYDSCGARSSTGACMHLIHLTNICVKKLSFADNSAFVTCRTKHSAASPQRYLLVPNTALLMTCVKIWSSSVFSVQTCITLPGNVRNVTSVRHKQCRRLPFAVFAITGSQLCWT